MNVVQTNVDVIVVGGGLAGLVVAAELADAGKRVMLLEGQSKLGGQALWSLGGLFLVNTPEQRRLGITDSVDLALADWLASAEFNGGANDAWARRWAQSYVEAAATDLSPWLRSMGVSFFPLVQWAERGGGPADGPGNSMPRFHVVWGTGPGLLEPFLRRVETRQAENLIDVRVAHRVEELVMDGGRVAGCLLHNTVDERSHAVHADAVVIATGGIGANHELVRRWWPDTLRDAPADMLQGVPDHVDGSGLLTAQQAGAHVTNIDRMWNYPEGIAHHTPVWNAHAVRVLAGPGSLWLDARGRRLPPPLYPGVDTLRALRHLTTTGSPHSWLLCNHRIAAAELRLSGSVHNPDLTNRSIVQLLKRALPRPAEPIQAFIDRGLDIVTADDPHTLVARMNALVGDDLIDEHELRRQVLAYDRQAASGFGNDAQLAAISTARRYLPDRLMRTAGNQQILDPSARPLIAIRMRAFTRKSLGGLQTDLSSRVLQADGTALPGLYAAGEVAGFGGGGVHGHRSLEGTFLGGCLHTGLRAARGIQTDMS
ncbi:MAG: FAD-binding dehydrogenase [Actinobacteria bacterium]|nr:FAD-binding dehydrogenase [Actinomycetota bacterium]